MFPNHTGRQGMSIVSKRKRPRQANYASTPAQNPTTPLHIEIPDDALLEMAQDFENNAQNYTHFSSNNRSHPSYQNQRPSSQNGQLYYSPQKHPNNYGGNVAYQKRPKLGPQNNYFRGTENCPALQQNRSGVNVPRSYTASGNSFQSNYQNSANGPRRNFTFVNTNAMGKPQQSYSGKLSEYSWNRNIDNSYGRNSPAKATTPYGSARQPRSGERASFSAAMNAQKANPIAKNVYQHGTNTEAEFSLQAPDKSMRLITTTIQGVKKWSEYRDQIHLVFEIYVTLDSVPTSNDNGTAKLFNIKDSTGSNRCIFWEMDQKLPKMARGQVYRLVGASERKTGNFQCFVIRQAQPSEQHLAKQRIEMCHEAMTKLVSTIAES